MTSPRRDVTMSIYNAVNSISNSNKYSHGFAHMENLLKGKLTKNVSIQEIPETIKVTIDEISSEFGEKRNFRSNLTHVLNIIQKSGKKPEHFTSYLYEARSITKQQGNVKKKCHIFLRFWKISLLPEKQ